MAPNPLRAPAHVPRQPRGALLRGLPEPLLRPDLRGWGSEDAGQDSALQLPTGLIAQRKTCFLVSHGQFVAVHMEVYLLFVFAFLHIISLDPEAKLHLQTAGVIAHRSSPFS